MSDPEVLETLRSAHKALGLGDYPETTRLVRLAFQQVEFAMNASEDMHSYRNASMAAKLANEHPEVLLDCSRILLVLLERLHESHPDYRAHLFMLGSLCEASGKVEESKSYYKRANDLLEKVGRDRSVDVNVEEEEPVDEDLKTILGMPILQEGDFPGNGDDDASSRTLQSEQQKQQPDVDKLSTTTATLLTSEELDAASDIVRQLIRSHPGAADLLTSAKQAFRSGKFLEATRTFELVIQALDRQGLRTSDSALDCRMLLGKAFLEQGDLRAAIAEYGNIALLLEEKFGKGHPHSIEHLKVLSELCNRAGKFGKARAVVLRAHRLAEEYLPRDDVLRSAVYELHSEIMARTQPPLKESIPQTSKITVRDVVSDGAARKAVLRSVRAPIFVWLVCCALTVVAVILWMPLLIPESTAPAKAIETELPKGVFRTVDGKDQFEVVSAQECVLLVDGEYRRLPYVLLKNDVGDWLAMASHLFSSRTIWLEKRGGIIIAQSGQVFFETGASELKVVDAMRRIAFNTEQYFQEQKTFPKDAHEWPKYTWTNYVHPTTEKLVPAVLQVFSRGTDVSDVFDGARDLDAILPLLLKGGKWSGEQPLSPFAISCASFCFDEAGYAATDFFMHCADREGHLIPLIVYLHKNLDKGNLHAGIDSTAVSGGSTAVIDADAKPLPGGIVYVKQI